MKILIVTATPLESGILTAQLTHPLRVSPGLMHGSYQNCSVSVLTTGIGMINTVYHMTKILAGAKFDLVLNIGICGSYSRNLKVGDVVQIYEEIFSELGATDGDGNFLDLEALGFTHFNARGKPHFNILRNPHAASEFFTGGLHEIFSGKSLTVHNVHGDTAGIERMKRDFAPDFENMEGGAVAYVCLNEELPYFEFRAISNYVESRNKDHWNIPLACERIQQFALKLIQQVKSK